MEDSIGFCKRLADRDTGHQQHASSTSTVEFVGVRDGYYSRMERGELEEFYRRYLLRCNEHRFEELGEFVDEDVEVNGAPHDVRRYAAGLAVLWSSIRTSTGIYSTF
jgi:hypothetical protein